MSVQEQITRIQSAKQTLATKAASLGIGTSSDKLDMLATKYNAIVDKGSPEANVKEGESYTIEPGYYHGGTVTGVSGGGRYTLQAKIATPTKSEQSITSDSGYYGLSEVTVNPIPTQYQDVSNVTATASDVLATKVFVTSAGTVTTGSIVNNGAINGTITGLGAVTGDTEFTILAGYTTGGKVTLTKDIENALSAI